MAKRLMLDVSSDARHGPIAATQETAIAEGVTTSSVEAAKCAFGRSTSLLSSLTNIGKKISGTSRKSNKRKERGSVFWHALEILLSHKPEAKSVLDIGCGIGTFLALCRDDGFNVTGVEPSSIACKVAKREYGLELINEPFSSRIFPGPEIRGHLCCPGSPLSRGPGRVCGGCELGPGGRRNSNYADTEFDSTRAYAIPATPARQAKGVLLWPRAIRVSPGHVVAALRAARL